MALARTLRPGKDYVRLTHQGEAFEGEVWAVDTCGRTTELQLMLTDGMRVLTVDSETPCEVRPQSAVPGPAIGEPLSTGRAGFEMDGIWHTTPGQETGCCSRRDALVTPTCPRCEGYTHFQAVYGGFYRECEDCHHRF